MNKFVIFLNLVIAGIHAQNGNTAMVLLFLYVATPFLIVELKRGKYE